MLPLGSLGSKEREKLVSMRNQTDRRKKWMHVSKPEDTSDMLDILVDFRFIAERDFLRGGARRDPPTWRV